MAFLRHTRIWSVLWMLLLGGWAVAEAGAPMVRAQVPGFFRMMLGEFEITALNDGTGEAPASLLTNVKPEAVRSRLTWMYQGDPVPMFFNAFLVNTGRKLVLIDTGAGSGMGPGAGHLVENLLAAGYRPEQVDEIYITHMHGDHIGGLTRDGQRVFPNAIVRASKPEADHFLNQAAGAPAPAGRPSPADLLNPYIKLGHFETFIGDVTLVPGIRTLVTAGHTPGHACYIVESRGQSLLVWGDIVHMAAVQLADPAVTIQFDTDSAAAAAQRLRVMRMAADLGYWVAGAHMAFPGLGHLRPEKEGFVWIPASFTRMN